MMMPQIADSALILIDLQRDFCEPGGYADRQAGVEWVGEALTQAAVLLRAARRAGVRVIHTREGYSADLSDCTEQRQFRSRQAGAEIGARGPLGRLLIRGEPGHALCQIVAPQAGELVVDKASYGAFYATELEAHLRRWQIRHLYLAGVTADVCVHTTLREATDRGYFCQYVTDAISTFDPVIREACERMVEVEGGVWGTLTQAAKVVAQWQRLE